MECNLEIEYIEEKCVRCGNCARESECGGVKNENGKIVFDFSKDEDWNLIIQTCPTGALLIQNKSLLTEFGAKNGNKYRA